MMEFRPSHDSRKGKRRPRQRRGRAICDTAEPAGSEVSSEENVKVFNPDSAGRGTEVQPAAVARRAATTRIPAAIESGPARQDTSTDPYASTGPHPSTGPHTGIAPDAAAKPASQSSHSSHPSRPGSTAVAGPTKPASHVTSSPAPIAIVGLACRYPDANDLGAFFQMVTTGRRAFRRIPPCRVDLADYYSSDPAAPDATYSTRAAMIEGWRFDRAAFGISPATYASCDPAQWLALETAARTLAAAGFPEGNGLPAESTGVFVGNTLAGDVSRATALRLRWPYARRVLADALVSADVPDELAGRVLAAAATRYVAPFPPVTTETLAGSSPGNIAAWICGHHGFLGGGFAVDTGGASSLSAVTSACSALRNGELDVALAGGVCVNLDPLDLVGLAKLGVLATGDMRIYDASPTGLLPGEGCGMVLLMRSSDALAAGLPVYAEILGWGMASAGHHRRGSSDPQAMLLAMRRAYEQARCDPADIAYIEGCGTGTAHADEAELTALATLRGRARQSSVLGSATACIGHTGAAAGAAGLIKAVLTAANGILPPSTGVSSPHQILRESGARLRTPDSAEHWPDSEIRRAAVSACGTGGLSVHLVLASSPSQRSPGELPPRLPDHSRQDRRRPAALPRGLGHPCTFLLQATNRTALGAILARIADVAAWLSDAELRDLACQLALEAADQGTARVAIVATRQEQLARLANEAITMLPKLTGGLVSTRPGIFAADGADGRVTLLLAGQPADDAAEPASQLGRALAILRKIDELGVRPVTAVGHDTGQLAGLVWAGCASPDEAAALSELRAAALTASPAIAPGNIRRAIDMFGTFRFKPPRHRLICGFTGTELMNAAEIPSLLSAELLVARSAGKETEVRGAAADRLARAVRAGAAGASLLLQTAPDRALTRAIGQLNEGTGQAGQRRKVPVVTIDNDPSDDRHLARAAAALFVAGALTRPELLYPGRPSRPIDIWQQQTFITHPCQTPVDFPQNSQPETGQSPQARLKTPPSRLVTPSANRTNGPGLPADAVQPSSTGRTARSRQTERAESTSHGKSGTSPSRANLAPAVTSEPAEDEAGARWVVGVSGWLRCYAERTAPPGDLAAPPGEGPWEVFTGGCDFLRKEVADLFRHEPGAGRTLAVLGELPAAGTLAAAVLAARSAVGTGHLVAISPDQGLAGIMASLQAEQPQIGVVVVRAALTPESLAAVSKIAAVPGQYRELVIGPDGELSEPVMVPADLAPGDGFPLGSQDVVLISRTAGAAGLALAQVLACSGAAIAVIGRDRPRRDDVITTALEQLRLAGTEVGYEIVDPASPAALAAALRRIERRFGRVSAVAQAVTAAAPRLVADLTLADVEAYAHEQARVLDQLVTAIRTLDGGERGEGRLKLIVTFGSVAGRYGIAGGAMTAAASGVLAGYGEQLASLSPGCRALQVEWPAWAGTGLGERPQWAGLMRAAGFSSVSMEAGSRQLLRLMGAGQVPARVAIHGRAGWQVPRPVALASLPRSGPARYIAQVLVDYPGVELVAQVTICALTDPYLRDYQIDGVGFMPPALAIEAMAQVASALAGTPLRIAADVAMLAPIVLAAGEAPAVLRVCGLRDEETVTVIVRCDSTGFAVDHFRATFSLRPAAGASFAAPAEPDAADTGAAETGALPADPLAASSIYGPVCFQTGRFERITSAEIASSRSVSALVSGADTEPWFEGQPDGEADHDLLLGSAGITDAALQVVQLAVPHRRLMFAGCQRATFAGQPADSVITISAAEVVVPRQRSGEGTEPGSLPGETIWDVAATDSAGRTVLRLQRLRLRDAGPLPRTAPWPLSLAGCLLERAVAELGLGTGVRIRLGRRMTGEQATASGWVFAARDEPGLAGLDLAVRADGPASCGWRMAGQATRDGQPNWLEPAGEERLRGILAESKWTLAHAIAACAGPPPERDVDLEVRQVAGADWLLISDGTARIAVVLLDLADVDQPVAIAIMTGALDPAGRRPRSHQAALSS
jgi:enediyne polyketide synthase